ncbi:hypothetical protein LASUN_25740 [Lentilactobacillus sunkii]|jgi:hypothetical protein|uniref:Lipoprotein n=1 Tax=Lentilactobacillus sunkii TaxID=481719 RepID=A0A1E7X847_9LACO|nr:hypothetical protein [Lentilactobacillus sunkii]OFA09307.1 hypothetical protein LASUN_25740 [Lentilactobacillus sunkii]
MKKLFGLLVAAASLMVILSGCGAPTLSVQSHHLNPDGLAAVVKGKSNQKNVQYVIKNGSHSEAQNNEAPIGLGGTDTISGAYAITVPTKAVKQTMRLSAGGKHQTVTIAKANVLSDYSTLQNKYNQALTGTALSKKDQKLAAGMKKQAADLKKTSEALKTNKATSMSAMQAKAKQAQQIKTDAEKLKREQIQLAGAMKQAQASVKDVLLPKNAKSGVNNLVKTKDFTIRTNVDNQKVVGIAMMVPTKGLKNKSQMKSFVMSFSILANSVGANAKQVLKDFQKITKDKNKSSTTTPKIHSNGLTFSLGYSTTTLYIFITK